jgi:hypothetical protein
MKKELATHQKALAINLDPKKYGTVAETGAGQEVARWLFRVGVASGTVAKTMWRMTRRLAIQSMAAVAATCRSSVSSQCSRTSNSLLSH